MICLFDEKAIIFDSFGLKVLQPISAIVRKEDNGEYFLDLRDTSENFDLYKQDYIVAVDTPWGKQGFRVNNIELNGSKVDIKCLHLFYDAQNYLIADSYVVDNNANYAMDHLNTATDIDSPFETISNITNNNSLRIVRHSLAEAIKRVAERWGGHITLDNWTIGLYDTIGQDRGVSIEYGKNIRGFEIKENWDDLVTKIIPVGKDGILLPDIYLENNNDDYYKPYSKIIDFDQQDVDEEAYKDDEGNLDVDAYHDALIADLMSKATWHLQNNATPKVNYTLEAFIEGISDIGDTIRVKHPLLKNPLKTNVLAMDYDAIEQVIIKIEFGNFNPKLDNLIGDTDTRIESKVEQAKSEVKTDFDMSLQDATNNIKGIMSNSNVIYDGDQILVVDTLPKENATNVIRLNAEGIGFSNDGINGTFNSAWTIDGVMDMQQINTLNLVADRIRGGTLRLGFYEGNNGIIELYDQYGNIVGRIDQNGIEMDNPNGDQLKISPVDGIEAFSAGASVFSIKRDVTNIAKLHARDQIEMPPIKIVPIMSGVQAGWAFVALDTGGQA
jgi:phage minor structural protein